MVRGVEASRRGQDANCGLWPEGIDKWRREPTAPVAHEPSLGRVFISGFMMYDTDFCSW